jgi:hypothetical protein
MCIAFIGSITLLVLIFQKRSAALESAIASGCFPDGFRIEVVKAELTAEVRHRPRRLLPFSVVSEGISSAAAQMIFTTREENGSLSEARLAHQSQCIGLGLVLRAFSPDGKAFTSDHFVADEGKQLLRTRRKGTRSIGYDAVPSHDFPKSCGLLIEVEDGAGGWLPLMGPVFADTEDAHALAFRSSFPRSSAALRLRFLRPGHIPLEATLQNPGFQSTFPKLEPESIPARRASSRLHFDLESLNAKRVAGERFQFHPRYLITKRPPFSEVRYLHDLCVEDAQENRILYSDGYTLLPGHHIARLRYRLSPTPSTYPWQESEVTFIAEGRWDEGGKRVIAHLTAQAHHLGFTHLNIILSAKKGHPSAPWPRLLEITLEGAGGADVWSHLNAAFPSGNLTVFDDGPCCIGSAANEGWGLRTVQARHAWTFRAAWSGKPMPGSVFRLALVPKPTSDEFEFIVDLSSHLPK